MYKELKNFTSLIIDYRGKTPLKLGLKWSNSGYRALSAKNIKTGHIVNEDSIYYGDDVLYKAWMKDEVQRGDILITSEAPFGEVFYWDSDEKIILSQRLFCLRPKNIIPKYLYYAMISRGFQAELLSRATGTTVTGLRQPELLRCKILEKSPTEQQHIVDILGSIDNSIENNEKIIETLEEKMLLEYDSLISNASLSVSEMQEIFDISIGKTPPRKESHWFTENPEDVKWLSISDMGKAKVFAFDSSEKITAEGIEKYNVKIAPENTVLLSFKLTIGKVAITGCEMATNEAIAHFVSNDENIVEYLYCYLKRYNFDMLGNTSSIATAVNSKTIKAMKFYYPDTESLVDFHRIAEPLIKKIKHLLITNAKLNELKQLYLKKFFG